MNSLLQTAEILVDPMLLAIAVIYIYGFIVRLTPNTYVHQIVMGVTFGVGAIFAMLMPITFADGVIIDMRNLLIGLSSAFFGIPGAIIAGGMGLVTRFYIGGSGAIAGMTGIAIATCAGLFWAHFVRGKLKMQGFELVLLGLLICTYLLAVVLLPTTIMWSAIYELIPVLIVFNVVGTVLIGSLMIREEGLAAENAALLNAATTDPLTRLQNRRSAVAAYNALPIPKNSRHGIAILCFDVDNFKIINDTYGHVWGDKVLAEISDRISKTLRPTDVFSRLGGDEFLIILPAVTEAETQQIAERCRDVIAQTDIADAGETMNVTISVGAEWLSERPDFLTFVARADEALYHAKKLGRNCVSFAWLNTATAAQAFSQATQNRTA
ncbi:diguanylate cyclase [Loktanella ponticola]|uniref:diguanylate cyclase n=1 Tax=Yoonia ponticola TaxID=1524255 RepID=A0A7W9BM32_9RHOB|nr:diguanylate cyclase [Yoonia ponticola]MBB5723042.1 diguanylate cyclase [Yoonia ponticola]